MTELQAQLLAQEDMLSHKAGLQRDLERVRRELEEHRSRFAAEAQSHAAHFDTQDR